MYATWLAFTSTVFAWARFAIMRSCSGLIDRSAVATMYHVGLVFQAGFVTLWVNASVEIGTCDTAIKPDSADGSNWGFPHGSRLAFEAMQYRMGDLTVSTG